MTDVPGLHVSMGTRNQVAFASNEPAEVSYLGEKPQIRRSVKEHMLLLPGSQHSWKEAEEKVFPLGHLWASTTCLVPVLQLWCHM